MDHILTLNAGSSSIKFALFARDADGPAERLRGQVEGLGAQPRLEARAGRREIAARDLSAADACDHDTALSVILALLEDAAPDARIGAVGHRVVHGGPDHAAPLVLDAAAIAALDRLVPLAPLHQPHNLAGVCAARGAFPEAVQIACFDTAFHRSHPWVADTYALPQRFYDAGVRRYGFHGLSYEYVAGKLAAIAPGEAAGRVVIAHLGNGASMCALKGGRSVGSTMGFTALDGLPMGTRCGQLDPGVVLYLMAEKAMTAAEIETLLYRESGLKGLSGLSHDMRTLESAQDPEAHRAIAYFTHRVRRELGAMAAILDGLDTLVFTGGIGENAARVRTRICEGMDWLGLVLDETRNAAAPGLVSTDDSRVRVRVIPTDEEAMIARHAAEMLARPA